MKRKVNALLLFIFAVNFIYAQNKIERCGTVAYNKAMEEKTPALGEARQNIERLVANQMNMHQKSINNVITIPVVVHIVYNSSADSVSDAQVNSQIDALNRDYGRTNSDTNLTPAPWKSIAANTGIQFCLAIRKPNGDWTNGIERRKNTSVVHWSADDAVKHYSTGGLDVWSSSNYLNIWVCNIVSPFIAYATMPPVSDTLNDGVVIDFQAFGTIGTATSPFNLGRTGTHDIGHWLGLYHIWGDDGGLCPPPSSGGDDWIFDTAPQASFTTGCPTFPLTDGCSSSSPGIMFMNYMDYTDDACMNMFTLEQATRMNLIINLHRPGLLTSQGCVPAIGINEADSDVYIELFPNPAISQIEIRNPKFEIRNIELYNILGEKIFSQEPRANSQQVTIDVSNLPGGIYFIKVACKNEQVVRKIVIQR